MVWLTKVEYVEGYQVRLGFNNGTEGILDFKAILGNDTRKPVKELLQLDLFRSCRLNLDTITWDNGVDFAPEFLLETLKKSLVA